MTAMQTADPVEAARLEWRARLDANADHQAICDLFVVDAPCGGCDVMLQREQAAYRAYYLAKTGRRR